MQPSDQLAIRCYHLVIQPTITYDLAAYLQQEPQRPQGITRHNEVLVVVGAIGRVCHRRDLV